MNSQNSTFVPSTSLNFASTIGSNDTSSTLTDHTPTNMEIDTENRGKYGMFKKPKKGISRDQNTRPDYIESRAKALEDLELVMASRQETEDRFEKAVEDLVDIRQVAPVTIQKLLRQKFEAEFERLKNAPIEDLVIKPLTNTEELMRQAEEEAKKRHENNDECQELKNKCADVRAELLANKERNEKMALGLKKMLEMDHEN